MKVALVGAEIEENLALRYIHSSLEAAGHQPALFGFNARNEINDVARQVAAWGPDLVGLSMLFTSRSHEFVALAHRLRMVGFRGHLTGGGHFASFHATELLTDHPCFDSIVHGEGEETMVELASDPGAPARVAGMSYRDHAGAVRFTGKRENRADLDARPWPTRPDVFHEYLGKPIANLLAGRGCYANCHFCSINAWHRQQGGKRFRMRDVRCVAREMAMLYHDRGIRIFNFQDDNFFLPTAKANLERLGALAQAMRDEGIGRIAIQAKARPDSIDDRVIALLVEMGLFRIFLGVETDAVSGLQRLGRGTDRKQNHEALAVLQRHDVHTCFNLLMFDPESDIASLRENVHFMARQHFFPLNFCRVEVYAGTALEKRLRAEGRLDGDYMGLTYEIADPAAQTAYVLFWKVFAPRNFGQGGMHHESMRIDYNFHILEHFHPGKTTPALRKRVKGLVADLNRDSARLMGRLLDIAATLPDSDGIEAAVESLRQDRAAADRVFKREAADLLAKIQSLAETLSPTQKHPRKVGRAVAAALLASAWVGADSAIASDPEDEEAAEDRSDSVIPEVEAANDETVEPVEEPDDKLASPPDPYTHMCEAAPPPYDLYDKLKEPYTHMCEAAPPPYDLIDPGFEEEIELEEPIEDPYTHMCEAAPPPYDLLYPPMAEPLDPIHGAVLGQASIQKLRDKYQSQCSATVTFGVTEAGKVVDIVVATNPEDEKVAKKVTKAMRKLKLDPNLVGASWTVNLWSLTY